MILKLLKRLIRRLTPHRWEQTDLGLMGDLQVCKNCGLERYDAPKLGCSRKLKPRRRLDRLLCK